MNRLVRGIGAVLVVLALVVGAPLALVVWMGNPWPPGGWAEAQLVTNRTLYGAIAVVGWLAWAQMTACILLEAVAAIRGTAVRTLRFATDGQKGFARALINSIAALGIGASTVASGSATVADPPVVNPEHVASQLVGHDATTSQGPQVTVDGATTVWRLAETHLGDGARWREILDLNRGTTLADGTRFTQGTQAIPPGSTLRLPAGVVDQMPAATPQHQEPPAGAYTVKAGDTLWDISEKTLDDPARYLEIYRASADLEQPGGAQLTDPDHIEVGWKLTIPGATEGSGGAGHRPRDNEQRRDAAGKKAGDRAENRNRSTTPPKREQSTRPEAEPTAPAESAPQGQAEAEQPPETAADRAAGANGDESALGTPWMLAGLTGGGVLLAGALLLGLQQRRRAQSRARRPGRGIAALTPEVAPAEMSINAAGAKTAATVELMDAILRRVASTSHAAGIPMPALAAVELGAHRITLHLSSPAELQTPWEGTPDQAHWHCSTDVDLDELGPTPGYVEAPYPLLVTIGESTDGSLWLLNCEELGTLTLTGDAARGRDFARHLAAQLAVNPWSHAVEVDCIGVAAETAGLHENVRYHAPGEASAAIGEIVADAVAMVERATAHGTDVSTGRTGQIDDDVWPSRLLLLDSALEAPAGLHELAALIAEQSGRTATSILVTGEREDIAGFAVQVTGTGRVILEHAGLDLAGVGLTSEETHGCALLYAQSEVLEEVPVPVDESATEGWEAYADKAGALRPEHTVPRGASGGEICEPAESLLEGGDEEYLREAAVVPTDLDAVAPKVHSRVRSEVEESDPTLDADIADWFSPTCHRPRLSLLGPVTARTHGKALTDRKPYFTELLAFMALRRRHGVTKDEICDAFGIEAGVARNYVKVVRSWLGTNPRTGEPHLPNADKAPAAQVRGINVYQVDDGLLVDLELFKRLRVRGQSRGGAEGRRDLITALELVTGRPFDHQRQAGWSWLFEGERHDEYLTVAIADVAFIVATYYLEKGDLPHARAATELAVIAAPYEEPTRLCLVRVTEAEGDHREAERILREEVCNRSDDGGAPTELSERTQAIIRNHDWLAS